MQKLKENINMILIIIGGVGMTVISAISIIDSHATDIMSAIPVQLFFTALFISGYVKHKSK